MFADNDFKAKLIVTDIVVWNGLVTRWGAIENSVLPGDMVRMANDEELENYHGLQSWHHIKYKRSQLMGKILHLIGAADNRPTHFKIMHSHDSAGWKYIPDEWKGSYSLDSYVIDLFVNGKWAASKWLGMESFEFPIAEELSVNLLKYGEISDGK